MCANYLPVTGDRLTPLTSAPPRSWKAEAYPGYEAPYLRASAVPREACLGRFGLVPWWTKPEAVSGASRHTYNARSETVASKPSFRDPWKRRQFCVIPADAIYEPRYEAGGVVRWRIERADREPMLIAGIWESWRPKAEGEAVESFAMLTLNADRHPLMSQFHAPDDEKRMVALLDPEEIDRWLGATPAEAAAMIREYPAEWLTARPEPRPARSTAPKRTAD